MVPVAWLSIQVILSVSSLTVSDAIGEIRIKSTSFENQIDDLAISLNDVAVYMRIFSLSMRSLYAEKSLSGSSDTTWKINKIRDNTRKDALVYVKGILPASNYLVRNLLALFDYYEILSFEEWEKILPDILEEVKGYKQCCMEIIRLHDQILISLKKGESEAKVLIKELRDLTKKLEREKAALEKFAFFKNIMVNMHKVVADINTIAELLLNYIADADKAQVVVAEGDKLVINNEAIVVVSNTLIPALEAFSHGLEKIMFLFIAVEGQVTTFQDETEKAMDSSEKAHYTLMKGNAKNIKKGCTKFIESIFGVRTDILSIPQSAGDMKYVDKWVKNQQDEIKKKYGQNLSRQLRKMLTHLSME